MPRRSLALSSTALVNESSRGGNSVHQWGIKIHGTNIHVQLRGRGTDAVSLTDYDKFTLHTPPTWPHMDGIVA